MSTADVAVGIPASGGGYPEQGPLLRFVQRYSPAQGWDTFLLILGAALITGFTVIEADWVETPGLLPLIVLSSVTGLVLAKIRLPWPALHAAGLALGFVAVVWQASGLADAQDMGRFAELWDRLGDWYGAATSGGISTDLLPFSLALLSLGWLLGYTSTWFLFRSNNLWIGLVFCGVAILTNLSFLPEGFETRFFAFIFLAMLLVIRMTYVQHLATWSEGGFKFMATGRWLSVQVGVGLCLIVVLVTSFLPLNVYIWRTAVDVWNAARSPIENIEGEFARLFSPIASRKDVAGRYFGDTLAFKGPISLGGDVVMQARSEYPSYWLNRTYSEYTPQGWLAGDRENTAVGPNGLPPPTHESFKRTEVLQTIVVQFDTNNLWMGGNTEWVSRDAIVETLKPKSFTIDIRGTEDGDLPEDVQAIAQDLRRMLNPLSTAFVEAEIAQMLPQDLSLVSVSPGIEDTNRTRIDTVTITRKEPTIPDVVGWRTQKRLKEGEAYSMTSFVSLATVEELREAPAVYSGYMKDHYLQLPGDLPQRVRDLAAEVTADADNPMDKALAVQDFMRSDVFEYTQDIQAPPRGADGVDHFLFNTRAGYSDYHASAMTVMMRASGIPARLAAGYAAGEDVEGTDFRAVKDADSHSWVQVYFPGHGWIDFEPTPAWPLQPRGAPLVEEEVAAAAEEDTPAEGSGNPVADDPCLGIVDEDEAFMLEDEDCIGDIDRPDSQPRPSSLTAGLEISLRVAVAAAIAAVLALFAWGLWRHGFAGSIHPETLYKKMGRLGRLAGVPRRAYQTPNEYGSAIASAVPSASDAAMAVTAAFSAQRYGNHEPTEDDGQELARLWRSLRGGLAGRAFRRLLPMGGS